jgi:hypothetical protein
MPGRTYAVMDQVKYSWRCTLCDADGFGGGPAFVKHYRSKHQNPATYTGYVIEAREEHGLKGAAAYQWAHAAYVEYVRNQ